MGDMVIFPSVGLKNCPTAIDAAGGGLPETLWKQSTRIEAINS